MNERDREERARARVDEIRSFFAHAVVYGLFNGALAILNLATLHGSDGVVWFVWPLVGWGVALATHAVFVFGIGRFLNKEWVEQRVRRELERQTSAENDKQSAD